VAFVRSTSILKTDPDDFGFPLTRDELQLCNYLRVGCVSGCEPGREDIQVRELMAVADQADEGLLGWQERALCAQTDPEAFFPEKGGSTREAKKVCQTCDVKAECLEYALGHDERFGIWGGLSERERRKLKRRA